MWQIEHQCPQCGAPVLLEETDRILTCPYCRVSLYLAAHDYTATYLPASPAVAQEMLFIPYWRFKGLVFSCQGDELRTKIIDLSRLAVPITGMPFSLGVRPQALKLKFIVPETAGTFFKPRLTLENVVAGIEEQLNASSAAPRFHQAYIGETASLIYAPVFIHDNRLCDAILNKSLAPVPAEGLTALEPCDQREKLHLTFVPCLCPDCGWNLEGGKESLVLLCKNCHTAWSASKNGLYKIAFARSAVAAPGCIHLPFWKITAQVEGLQLGSFADLLRLNNAPEVITPAREQQELAFWIPAFKIAPDLFLLTAQRMTFFQEQGPFEESLAMAAFHPVTLPSREAVESITPLLAQSAVPRKDIFPKLPLVSAVPRTSTLVYIPFKSSGSELIHYRMPLSISRNALKWGLSL